MLHLQVTFFSYAFFAFFPLLGYASTVESHVPERILFAISCCLTLLMLFVLGAVKSRFTTQAWCMSGFEMMLFGGLVAAVSFVVGWCVDEAPAITLHCQMGIMRVHDVVAPRLTPLLLCSLPSLPTQAGEACTDGTESPAIGHHRINKRTKRTL